MQVCSCNDVTKAEIKAAVSDESTLNDGAPCTDAVCVTTHTRAGATCGSCKPVVKKIVEDYFAATGKEVDRSLCPALPDDPAGAVRRRRRARLHALRRHRRGSWQRPRLRHLQAGGRVDPGQPAQPARPRAGATVSSRTPTTPTSPTCRRTARTPSSRGSPAARSRPDKLIVIGEVARDFGLYTKITGGQRIDLFGARMEDLPTIWKRLVDAGMESGHAYGKSLRTVKSCVGSTWCRYGVQDSVGLAIELELRYRGLRSPHKLKGGVSGCARECAEARSKDFGVIATEKGWNLYVGGNGGAIPAHAQLLAGDLDKATLIHYLDRFLMYYIRTADRLQRTSYWMDSVDGGLDRVREVVVDDALGLGAGAGGGDGAPRRRPTSTSGRPRSRTPRSWPASCPSSTRPAPPTPTSPSARSVARSQAATTPHGPVSLGTTIPVGAPVMDARSAGSTRSRARVA